MIEHVDLIGANIRPGHFGMNYNYSILFSERWRLGDMRTLTQAYNMSIINTKRTVEGSLDWQKSSKVVRLETVTSFKHYSFKIQFLTTVSYYKNLEIVTIGNSRISVLCCVPFFLAHLKSYVRVKIIIIINVSLSKSWNALNYSSRSVIRTSYASPYDRIIESSLTTSAHRSSSEKATSSTMHLLITKWPYNRRYWIMSNIIYLPCIFLSWFPLHFLVVYPC